MKDFNYSLFNDMREGNDDARNQFFEENAYLIDLVLDSLDVSLEDYEDVFMCGVIGLLKAIDNFDEFRKKDFFVLAIMCINNQIKKFYKTHNSYLSHNESDIQKNGCSIFESIPSLFMMPEDELLRKIELVSLNQAICLLSEEEKNLITLYYGLNGSEAHDLKFLSEKFNCTVDIISDNLEIIREKLKQIIVVNEDKKETSYVRVRKIK